MLTSKQQQAVQAVKEALAVSTPDDRAELAEEISQAIYDWTKFEEPGGEGLDGRDGPERRSLGKWLDVAKDHRLDWPKA